MNTLYADVFVKGDYKSIFTHEVDKLTKQDLTVEFKNKLVQALTDAYIDQTGKVPDNFELSRLATWIIEDKSNDPDKVTNTEYPVFSTEQMKLRWRRESVSDGIEDATASGKYKINGKRATRKKTDCDDTGFRK